MINNMAEINGYDLSRDWFNWCFENSDKIKPTHTAMYFFIIEHCNRLGWKDKFGLPMEMTKDAIGISNYRTYSNTFEDLISWGFIKVYQRSKNQYSANVIGLVKNAKASTKALSKATQKHSQKQSISIVGIDKPINLEPINQLTSESKIPFEKVYNEISESQRWVDDIARHHKVEVSKVCVFLETFLYEIKLKDDWHKGVSEVKKHFVSWLKIQIEKEKNSAKKENNGKSTSPTESVRKF